MGLNRKIKEEQIKSSGRAGLIGIGRWMVSRKILEVIKEEVKIHQKKVKYGPVEKLMSVVVMILGGGRGISEINQQVRPEKKLAQAFGLKGCAEQSVIQETLDQCGEKNIKEMEGALKKIYQEESLGYKHNYQEGMQILDVDLSGKPCGKKGEAAEKGYFSGEKNLVGRQIGRVVASRYGEIVVERLYPGNTTLVTVQQELVKQAMEVLELDETKRGQTVIRLDAGGGSQDQVNWLEAQGFVYCTKEYSGKRVMALIPKNIEWIPDPKTDRRDVAFLTALPTDPPHRRRVAVRCRKKNGQFSYGIIISTIPPRQLMFLTAQPVDRATDPLAVLLADVAFYDQRGGGVETAFRGSKEGLQITRRHKKRFFGQFMLLLLEQLAFNLLVWSRRALVAAGFSQIASFGPLRLIHSLSQIPGILILTSRGCLAEIRLCRDHPFSSSLAKTLPQLLPAEQRVLILAKN
ncbi:MAG TPA: transposase [Acidobacteriota bacterium]|nr:transposase [Acidobacteriota bacterium]